MENQFVFHTEEDKSYIQPYIKLNDDSDGSNDGKEIELDEWMEAKRDLLEFTFQLRSTEDKGMTTMTCQGKTRNMEDDLLSL